jgi:hypothetical protein
MKSMMRNRTKTQRRRKDTLRRICEKGITEPTRIWEVLESQGIQVTPGVIHAVIASCWDHRRGQS